ncbi:MAG TPA: protein kinase [Chthoniobacterales bacterium]|jgi:serine/threonine protein kinase
MDDLDFEQTIRGFAAGQKVFDRYTVKKVLGRGGMGVVWLAFDEKLERDVALKFLPELLVLDAASLDDLKRETKRNLELTHQHIVRVYDFAQDDRSAAISMEYVDGSTLSSARVERPNKVFEAEDLGAIIQQACAALEYAHMAAGIVHRDLKPANLMMNSRGQVKITDFGIARSLSDSISMLTMKKTSGTLVYMSPQQLDGERASPLDDVYSIGATIYELLTSKPPFYSGGVDKQIHEKTAPSMSERRKELGIAGGKPIPPHWEQTIAASLAKNPADRPQTTRAIAERLCGSALGIAITPTAHGTVSATTTFSGSDWIKKLQTVATDRPSWFPAAQWWHIGAAGLVAMIVILWLALTPSSKPGTKWVQSVLGDQIHRSFARAQPVNFNVKQLAIRSEGPGLAKVDATGSATATEPLYSKGLPADPSLRSKLAKLPAANEQAKALRDVGVDVPALNPNDFAVIQETAAKGQAAAFHVQFEAERVGSDWHVKKVTNAELSPNDALTGVPVGNFGSNALILGTEKTKAAEAQLSSRIDAFLAQIGEASTGASKKFAVAGRDPTGGILFPSDHAAVGERFPETRMRVLAVDELQKLSDEKLQYATNEIYARHGATFDKKVSAYFKNLPWYQPQPDLTIPEIEASLPSIESQNLKTIAQVKSTKQEQSHQQASSHGSSHGSGSSQQSDGGAARKARDAAEAASMFRGMMGGRRR